MHPRVSATLNVSMWATWIVVCVLGVGWCWLRTFAAAMTLFGDTITPAHTAQAKYFLDTAAIVSVVGASMVLLLAIALLIVNRARRWKGPAAAILLAVLSPWLPVFFALHGHLAGE